MKKGMRLIFSLAIILTFMLASFSTAKADSADAPVITPVSGDQVFSTSLVSIEALPGTVKLGEMTVPDGFPSGETQFGGQGIVVSGMDYGQASLCYNIKTTEISQGWGGKVGMWNGEKWDLLATTITSPAEGTLASACATITGSGTYAFVKFVVDPSLLPPAKCAFDIEPYYYRYAGKVVLSAQLTGKKLPAVNTIVSYKVLSYEPDGALSGDMEGTIKHGIFGASYSDFITVFVDRDNIESATLYVKYPSCSVVLHYTSTTGWD
ncbi:MAG: hypothetical protein VB013_11470 [Anaerolineaceae bacterium]|nr:hypothetical protein [Anaerolineaceae bacterium]